MSFTIYNLPPQSPRWDRIGVAFMAFCATWTAVLFTAMIICLWFRNTIPALRVRCLPLSFTAIAFLHGYWILAWLVWPIGGTMPVVLAYDIQYFFMGIWFPVGIAVFHASNLRFLYVAKRQRRFAADGVDEKDGCNGATSSFFCKLRNLPFLTRVMIFIGIGMVAQVRHPRDWTVSMIADIVILGSTDGRHVGSLQEVSPNIRNPWNRNSRRNAA